MWETQEPHSPFPAEQGFGGTSSWHLVQSEGGVPRYHLWVLFSLMMANRKNGCLGGAAAAYGLSSGRTGVPAKLLNLSFRRAGCKTGVHC